jgi:hypothetical protein
MGLNDLARGDKGEGSTNTLGDGEATGEGMGVAGSVGRQVHGSSRGEGGRDSLNFERTHTYPTQVLQNNSTTSLQKNTVKHYDVPQQWAC